MPANAALALTAAGSGTAYGIARSLRNSFGRSLRIVAVDTNPPELSPSSFLADLSIMGSPLRDTTHEAELVMMLNVQGITIWWPTLDEELVLAHRLAGEVQQQEIIVLAPPPEAASLCWDKLAMARWLTSQGLPSPGTWDLLDDSSPIPDDAILKPRRGVGSRGVILDRTPAAVRRAPPPGKAEMIAQARCEPPELTVDAFRGLHHPIEVALCRERLEVKAGVCTKARVFRDEAVEELVLSVGRNLQLTGAYCVQVMRDRQTHDWAITDVNGRPGAATRMSVACGFDVHTATVLDVWGHDPWAAVRHPANERFVVRHYEEDVA